MSTIKNIWKWLVTPQKNNPYNKMPRKMKYATKRDVEWMGDAGKACPLYGCIAFLIMGAIFLGVIIDIVCIMSRPAPF